MKAIVTSRTVRLVVVSTKQYLRQCAEFRCWLEKSANKKMGDVKKLHAELTSVSNQVVSLGSLAQGGGPNVDALLSTIVAWHQNHRSSLSCLKDADLINGGQPMRKMKTIQIHRIFNHRAQNAYDFIWFLSVMVETPMNSYGFWSS